MKPSLLLPLLAAGLILTAPASAQTGTVVASTSWTAAIARAAGAPSVTVIAPLELQHPPEYEVKPSDLAAVKAADLVVFAGYEKFASRLAETSGGTKTGTLRVVTDNVPATLTAQARLVAEKLGTLPAWEQWSSGFVPFTEGVRTRIQAALPHKRVVVQKMVQSWAQWAGFEVVGTFGPGDPSPAVVLDLVGLKPDLVLDNWHNPGGQSVAEALGVPRVELVNFPGRNGTRSLEDVFRLNEGLLTAAGAR